MYMYLVLLCMCVCECVILSMFVILFSLKQLFMFFLFHYIVWYNTFFILTDSLVLDTSSKPVEKDDQSSGKMNSCLVIAKATGSTMCIWYLVNSLFQCYIYV